MSVPEATLVNVDPPITADYIANDGIRQLC